MPKVFAILCALAALAAPLEAQTRPSTFVFGNNFWLNLHQFVRGEAYRRRVKATPGLDPASLSDADRATWTAAVDAYADFAKRDVLFDATLRALQDRLATVRDVTQLPDGMLDANTTRSLNAAAPIYRVRVWPDRQRGNDERIADAVGEIGPNSAVTYSGITGFSAHIQAGAASPRGTADSPLELMFHEAMHAYELGEHITSMIQEECARQSIETPPDLWLIMFTAGVLAQRELANGYKTYGERYPAMPSAVRAAFERDWVPSLDGKVPLAQALHDLVREAR